jgi:hypothetical protein
MGLISRAWTNLAPPGAMSPAIDLTRPPVSVELFHGLNPRSIREWYGQREYKRRDIRQDDRCRAEIDGETKPPSCSDIA